jgi:hypothetical protein
MDEKCAWIFVMGAWKESQHWVTIIWQSSPWIIWVWFCISMYFIVIWPWKVLLTNWGVCDAMVYNFIQINFQVLWIEMVRFLSQNYITPHNNLVNMITLLKYFPTSISTCMRNKLHASFYLRNVMNMSLFRFLNEVWFKICRESWLVHLSLILVITIFVYLKSKL